MYYSISETLYKASAATDCLEVILRLVQLLGRSPNAIVVGTLLHIRCYRAFLLILFIYGATWKKKGWWYSRIINIVAAANQFLVQFQRCFMVLTPLLLEVKNDPSGHK